MSKWNLIVDVAKCEDCNNCFMACKDEYEENNFPGYSLAQPRHGQRWMNILRLERGQWPLIDVAYLPVPCMHCENAPCMHKARDGAVYRRKDGIVIIDPEKAIGQKGIVDACPYGAVFWNEEKNVPQKCTLCAHLLDEGWKAPRCVQACPTGALQIVKVAEGDKSGKLDSKNLAHYMPEFKTNPRVYYKNLFRYTHAFIGGSVAYRHDGIEDCAEGAKVTLTRNSQTVDEGQTDIFGNFKFDNLEINSGKYQIQIAFKDYERKAIEIELAKSKNIGTIIFDAAE